MHNVPFERSRLGVAGGVWFQTLTGCGGMEAGFPLPTLKFPRISGVAECAPMARYVAVLLCHVFIFQGLSDLSARTWIFVWRVPSDSRRTRRWTRRTAARVTFSADHEIAFFTGSNWPPCSYTFRTLPHGYIIYRHVALVFVCWWRASTPQPFES